MDLVVKNIGRTPALNVVATSTPELIDNEQDILAAVFETPLAFLAPEREFRRYVGSAGDFLADEMPSSYTLRVTYQSADRKRTYDETYVSSVHFMKRSPYVERKKMHDLVEAVEKVAENVNGIGK